jgi:hypothetical protein
MERAVQTMLGDLERSGPEAFGAPVRSVGVLARDLGELFPATSDPLARRRRRACAARLARRSLSLATAIHGLIADRPDAARAWSFNVREVERLLEAKAAAAAANNGDAAACVRVLSRVAALVLELPTLTDDEEWQAGLIAFADEAVLSELHEACLGLTVAALGVAASS